MPGRDVVRDVKKQLKKQKDDKKRAHEFVTSERNTAINKDN